MWDDIIYVILLLISIAFGKITRQIQNTQHRKWASSLLGLGENFLTVYKTIKRKTPSLFVKFNFLFDLIDLGGILDIIYR